MGIRNMKVLLVDDSFEMQQCLSCLLAQVPNVDIVGCAEDMAGALALIESHRPEIVMLEIELRDKDRGMDVVLHVAHKYPDIKIVVLSKFNWQSMRMGLLAAGAHAYFGKASELFQARDYIAALAAKPPMHSTGVWS